MYIVFDTDNNFHALRLKYLLLELDTFDINGTVTTSYCVIDRDSITLQEIPQLEAKVRIHEALMRNYKQQNWEFCTQAMEKLIGSFKGEMDSFYAIMGQRIDELKTQELGESWDGIIQQA